MQRIEFSEMTNRLHRNLIAVAALIIGLTFFHIQIEKAATFGFEVKNLTTGVLLTILVAVMLYHCIAFSIRAFEEYRIWELQLTSKQTTYYDGGMGVIELADQLKDLEETIEKILSNSGAIRTQGQDIFTQDDANNLREAAKAAQIYAKRFNNFPIITRLRFWCWDIGAAVLITATALLLAWSKIPSGKELFCIA